MFLIWSDKYVGEDGTIHNAMVKKVDYDYMHKRFYFAYISRCCGSIDLPNIALVQFSAIYS